MKEYCSGLFVLLLFGLYYFSEGKPCPERTRPHKTRCDAYYKCTELTSDKHVWMPTRCEEGLIYEHSLTVCVLPADDWECMMDEHKTSTNINEKSEKRKTKPTSNSDADIYIVSNAEEEDNSFSSQYDDGKVEIIIGSDISDEGKDEEDEEALYDGSGNGAELVELDGLMPVQNRETEIDDADDDVPVIKNREDVKFQKAVQTMEQKELEEMLHTIKTKSEIGQPSTNIDPKFTAHLQRLTQLIDGLKQTYQTAETKPQDEQTLRPDQLNAFLAHFNIQNKFESLDPSEKFVGSSSSSIATSKHNRTLHYKHGLKMKLIPETKVLLSKTLPHHYGNSHYNSNSGGGYSNSQIVVNRPEGSVLFSLPENHYIEHSEYSSDNRPKISEETLKTVLELSKQMIAQQNVPKVIPNPTYYGPPIMQPILLTPHIDSPFSTNYNGQNSNNLDFYGHYSNGGSYNQNFKHKKPAKRPQINVGSNGYGDNDNDDYEISSHSDYSNNKPGTTIIHNNIVPVHVSNKNSGEKEMLNSYGQSLGLYPPLHEATDYNTGYNAHTNANSDYTSGFSNNGYLETTTKRPFYVSTTASSSTYGSSARPFEFLPTASTINQYFTPSEHLDEHNVNNIFPSMDNYGSIPRPMKVKNTHFQNYKPFKEKTDAEDNNGFSNQLFPQVNNHKVYIRPNSQNFETFEIENGGLLNSYQYDNNDDESPVITYSYGNRNKAEEQGQFSSYGDSGSQSTINTVFSSNIPYAPRPTSNSHNSISSSNSYYSSGKNKYTPISSPISSTYEEGTQLVNVGGNFISFEVFQNSILPLVGNNPAGLSSSLNNVEVITCAAGVRQPNITDCTRYYVCSKKDGKVLSYSCPPYTAFNSDTRICDAKTYALCNGDPIVPNYSVSENKRVQMETLKALQEAKRRQMLIQQQQQQQAIKSNVAQQYNPSDSSPFKNPQETFTSAAQDSSEQNQLNSNMQHTATISQSYGTTQRPQPTTSTVKKRKYYCKEGDKIADQTSIYNYFVCYKNAKGQMKGHRMTCSKSLIFCSKTNVCTLPSKCS